MTSPLAHEKVWFNKYKYDEAEREYFENLAKLLINNGLPITVKRSPVQIPELAIITPPPSPPTIEDPIPLPQTKITVVTATNDKVVENQNNVKDKDKDKRFKVKESKRNKQNKKMVQKKNEENKVSSNNPIMKNTLAGEVAKARQHIQSSLECMDGIAALASNPSVEVNKRLTNLEKQNQTLQEELKELKNLVSKLSVEVANCRKSFTSTVIAPASSFVQPAQKPPAKPQDDDDDDGVDLFGSDSEEEDEEAKKIREKRLAEYASRKSKKPVLIAKSNIILDVKPWDDETNMKELEEAVRKIHTDGLVWGASKLVPLAYGIHKLQISCVVEDDKVSVDWLQETIQEVEDFVQSVDIAAFNKV